MDTDGMPLASESVRLSPDSVLKPAMERATSWHPPTKDECLAMQHILVNYYTSLINGPSTETSAGIILGAKFLGLVVSRVKTFKVVGVQKVPESYLIFYTNASTKNYSGAFMMLRETQHSKVIIISPHDDSDNTRVVTKTAFTESYALAMFSNGHKRGSVKLPARATDFCHNTIDNNLATYTIALFCKLFKDHVCLHFHGFVENRKCMVNARHKGLGDTFKASAAKYTRLSPTDFVALPVYFTIDKLVNTSFYLKTEMPVAIYANNKVILRNVVLDMEKNAWAQYADTTKISMSTLSDSMKDFVIEEEADIDVVDDNDDVIEDGGVIES
jgi:hypothetical protein